MSARDLPPTDVGSRYGRLTVIEKSPPGAGRHSRWLCLCDCGAQKVVYANDLRKGHTQSCGCLSRDVRRATFTKHGHAARSVMGRNGQSKTYKIWVEMIKRCHNPSTESFQYYGGRGISVCDSWRESFENFLADMGDAPSGHSIERDENNGNYEPNNCRWATRIEQMNNIRSNVLLVTIEGVMTIAEFSRRYGLKYEFVQKQIKRHGATEIAGVRFRVAGRRDSMRPPPPEEIVAVLARKFNVEQHIARHWLARHVWMEKAA